jgi:hypothetical protein
MANANGEIELYGALRSKTAEHKTAFASEIYDETQGKFQSQINQETANDGLVSAKVAQMFTNAEKGRARTNIGAYSKPSAGIPKTDLTSSVQASLDKADGSLQSITQEEFDAIFND